MAKVESEPWEYERKVTESRKKYIKSTKFHIKKPVFSPLPDTGNLCESVFARLSFLEKDKRRPPTNFSRLQASCTYLKCYTRFWASWDASVIPSAMEVACHGPEVCMKESQFYGWLFKFALSSSKPPTSDILSCHPQHHCQSSQHKSFGGYCQQQKNKCIKVNGSMVDLVYELGPWATLRPSAQG